MISLLLLGGKWVFFVGDVYGCLDEFEELYCKCIILD